MPTPQKPDAIALLKADHRKVEDLFEKFENARSDRKQALVQEICTELCIHATIEEEIFYPACKGEIEDDAPELGLVVGDVAIEQSLVFETRGRRQALGIERRGIAGDVVGSPVVGRHRDEDQHFVRIEHE